MAQYDTFDRVPSDWRELLVVDAALSSGLVDALEDPAPARELAERHGLDLRATTAVLDALVGLGYASRDHEAYALTDGGRGLLTDPQDPRYRRNSFGHNAVQLRRWIGLPGVMEAGGPVPDREVGDLESFILAMDDVSRRSAPAVADGLLAAVPGAAAVLDAGGGPGTYARELAGRGVATVVFDRPEVVDLMAPRFADEELVTYEPGDMRETLPEGPFDIVLLFNVLHMLGPQDVQALIGRAADSVRDGGVVAVFEFLLGVSPRAPLFAVNMLVATEAGRSYTEEEFREWFADAGLVTESVTDLEERQEQLLIARKGSV